MQSLLLLSVCALTSTVVSSTVRLESRPADVFTGCDLSDGVASFASDLDVDVVFIVDVSRSMDSDRLLQASSLVDSIVDSLSLNPEFNRWNSSDSNSTYWNMVDFALSSWNSTDNSTFNREFFELLGASLAFGWNNTDNNGTSTREFLESFAFNAFNAWNNYTDNNSTFNRDFFETFAFGWNNTDNNGTSTREFLETFASNAVNAWKNYTDNNSTFNRDFFETFAFGWNNTDNNGTSTREFLETFAFNAVNAWNNYTDNNSTFGRNFFEMFTFPSSNHTGNYSRVGLIAVGDSAEIIFDFSSPFNNSINLTRSTASHPNLQSGIAEALDMFARAPERSARQIIYVISATPAAPGHPRFGRSKLHSTATMFKRNGGVVVVNDVAAVPKPGLHNLASPGFYKVGLKEDVNVELKNICEAFTRKKQVLSKITSELPNIAVFSMFLTNYISRKDTDQYVPLFEIIYGFELFFDLLTVIAGIVVIVITFRAAKMHRVVRLRIICTVHLGVVYIPCRLLVLYHQYFGPSFYRDSSAKICKCMLNSVETTGLVVGSMMKELFLGYMTSIISIVAIDRWVATKAWAWYESGTNSTLVFFAFQECALYIISTTIAYLLVFDYITSMEATYCFGFIILIGAMLIVTVYRRNICLISEMKRGAVINRYSVARTFQIRENLSVLTSYNKISRPLIVASIPPFGFYYIYYLIPPRIGLDCFRFFCAASYDLWLAVLCVVIICGIPYYFPRLRSSLKFRTVSIASISSVASIEKNSKETSDIYFSMLTIDLKKKQ